MDSYLDIARLVLRAQRRPMSARSIIEAARKADVIPVHLHGKTQQKTLHARLSEDILHDREASLFYRTEPGQFALALLRKSRVGLGSPFPGQTYPTASVTGMPSAV